MKYLPILLITLLLSCQKECDCIDVLLRNSESRKELGAVKIDTSNWNLSYSDGVSLCRFKRKKEIDYLPRIRRIDLQLNFIDDKYELSTEKTIYLIRDNVKCENPDLNGDYHSFELVIDYETKDWLSYSSYCFFTKFKHDSSSYFPYWQRQMCILNELGVRKEDMPNLIIECDKPLNGSPFILRDSTILNL